MAVLASAEAWPSSGQLLHCTKSLLKWCGATIIVHCNKFEEGYTMADETKVQAEAAAEAPAKVVTAIADTAEKAVKETATVAKRERAKSARRAKRAVAA